MNLNALETIWTNCQATQDSPPTGKAFRAVHRPVNNPDLMGRLHHFSDMPGRCIKPRHVQVWLPPDYDANDADRYAVLYMHDGQNLFESQKAFIGVDWGMDETMAALCGRADMLPTIVVGIWNTPLRLREYLPQRPFCDYQSQLSRSRVLKRYGGVPISDHYLRFVVNELKPFVDRRYRTRPEREFTFMIGSSMGGLISLYAICEYPHIFGGAGCLSTHWPIAHRSLCDYLRARLPGPKNHKIYLDYGDEANSTGYRIRQKRVEHLIRKKGYTIGLDWLTNWYSGEPHSETAWRSRVHDPLRFLLKREPATA